MALLKRRPARMPAAAPRGNQPRARRDRTGRARGWFLALACVLGLTASVRLSAADPGPGDMDESQIKAAFLYNFAKFVQWPASEANGPFALCTLGEDGFAQVLAQTVKGKSVRGRDIVVRRIRRDDNVHPCDIVFVSASESSRTADIVEHLRDAAVLMVGETPHFLREGGHIRFFVEGNRVRFQINAQSANQAGLKISSQLLSLSR
jgi:hypothetical protein